VRLQIIRANIERYERLLETEFNPVSRAALEGLLAEGRAEERLVVEERRVENQDKGLWGDVRQWWSDARRWRMAAEEYRAVAAKQSESARRTYLHLAQGYEALAERVEAKANGRREPLPKSADEKPLAWNDCAPRDR
jgi:hypothetical protein